MTKCNRFYHTLAPRTNCNYLISVFSVFFSESKLFSFTVFRNEEAEWDERTKRLKRWKQIIFHSVQPWSGFNIIQTITNFFGSIWIGAFLKLNFFSLSLFLSKCINFSCITNVSVEEQSTFQNSISKFTHAGYEVW
jgi:hypothetical protein